MNSWLALCCAGLLEIGFTTFMKLSNGLTSIPYTLAFIVCIALSFLFLNKAITHIPLGTAYAVWTGIGAFGTAIVGMVFFKDPTSFWRVLFLLVLIASILGLKLVSSD